MLRGLKLIPPPFFLCSFCNVPFSNGASSFPLPYSRRILQLKKYIPKVEYKSLHICIITMRIQRHNPLKKFLHINSVVDWNLAVLAIAAQADQTIYPIPGILAF